MASTKNYIGTIELPQFLLERDRDERLPLCDSMELCELS